MVNWVRVGTDVVIGGGVGAVDQLVQNEDDKRIAANPALGIMSQYGTYYNYGIPILAIVGAAVGWLKGDWATRLVTAGSQLAGRKVIKQVVKPSPTAWTPWTRQKQLEAQRRTALERARTQVSGPISEVTIPIITDEAILV